MEAVVLLVLEFLAMLLWPVLAIFGAVLMGLAVENAMGDVNIWKIFAHEKHIKELSVNGVTGRVAPSDDGAPNGELVGPKKPERAFAVSNLQIADVSVDVVPVDRAPVSLRINV